MSNLCKMIAKSEQGLVITEFKSKVALLLKEGVGGNDRSKIDIEFDVATEYAHSFRMRVLFAIQNRRPMNLDDGLQLFDLLDTSKNGTLTKQAIYDDCVTYHGEGESTKNLAVRDFIAKHENTALGLLKNRKDMDYVFGMMDLDKNGEISKQEWKRFLAQVVVRDLTYLVEKGWSERIAYWAHGLDLQTKRMAEKFTLKEWMGDFIYYQCNTHNILGLFFADPDNPITRFERFCIEFCTVSYIFFVAAYFQASGIMNRSMGSLYMFLAGTLGSMALRKILELINGCPCLIRRYYNPRVRKCYFIILERTGQIVNVLWFIASIGLLLLGIFYGRAAGTQFIQSWIYSWLESYGTGVIKDICTTFHPIPIAKYTVKTLNKIIRGVAGWQVQRETASLKMDAFDDLGTDTVLKDMENGAVTEFDVNCQGSKKENAVVPI